MFRRTRCFSVVSLAVGLGVGANTAGPAFATDQLATDQAARVEAARLELREVRRLGDDLIGAFEAELMIRLEAADPELAASIQRSLMFQHKHIEWSWETIESLPPQFMPALAEQSRGWKPILEQHLSRIHLGLDLSSQFRIDAAIERASAPARSSEACNAAQTEARICQVTSGADCYQADTLACVDFCGALLGFPVAFKAIAGDETEVTVSGFGFNFPSPISISANLVLHVLQILCNISECGGDVTDECTRNEIRELLEQQHRHINDFDLAAATQELVQGLGTNASDTVGAIETARERSAQLDEQLAEERQFIDDSELFAAEQDVSRDLFALRERLCTLEALLYRPVGDQDQVLSNCGTAAGGEVAQAPRVDEPTVRLVLSLMKECRELPSLYLPESEGGLLEVVRTLAINTSRGGGRQFHALMAAAERALRRRQYREAYQLYCQSIGGAS